MSDNKHILIKLLKVMAAYFGLYAIHYLILPNTPIHGRYGFTGFDISNFIMLISLLLFPIFHIALYSICVYIYDANAAYELGYSGIFDPSYSKEWLIAELYFLVAAYIIIYIVTWIIIYIIKSIKKHIKNKKDREGKI